MLCKTLNDYAVTKYIPAKAGIIKKKRVEILCNTEYRYIHML